MTPFPTNTGATCAGCPCSKRGSTTPTPVPSARRTSSRAIDGVARIRHYLIDFTRSLGSGIYGGAKLSWEGNEPTLPDLGTIGRNIAGMGIATPAWMKAKYPDLREVGAFEANTFDPAEWTTNQPIAPFANRLPDDTFWAAKQVMAFTDEDIRAIVQTGQYSKAAEDWITAALD